MVSLSSLRADFPAVTRHVYLNAAAASPTPLPVHEAVDRFHRELEEDGDIHWEAWIERVGRARASVASLVNADPDEIAFVPNTSTGMNLIVDLLEQDGEVVSDTLEFPAVTLPWVHRGVPVHFVEPRDGVLHTADFSTERYPGSATVLVSHVQFSNGCRQDLDTFGAARGGRNLVVCASQSAGAFPIDVRRSGIDALASAGHKWLCAGYGAGFCFMSRQLLARRPRIMGWMSVKHPFAFDNRRYELLEANRRHEVGCPPFAQIFALGAAVDYLRGVGIDRIANHVLALNTYLTDQLNRIGVKVLSPGGGHRSGETLCAFANPGAVVAHLKARDIHVTRKPEGIRVATHLYNDEDDVDRLIAALGEYRE